MGVYAPINEGSIAVISGQFFLSTLVQFLYCPLVRIQFRLWATFRAQKRQDSDGWVPRTAAAEKSSPPPSLAIAGVPHERAVQSHKKGHCKLFLNLNFILPTRCTSKCLPLINCMCQAWVPNTWVHSPSISFPSSPLPSRNSWAGSSRQEVFHRFSSLLCHHYHSNQLLSLLWDLDFHLLLSSCGLSPSKPG